LALKLNFSWRLRERPDEVWDAAIEPRRASALEPVRFGEEDGGPKGHLGVLDYVRRYGSVMGVRMYELDGDWVSLRDRLAA